MPLPPKPQVAVIGGGSAGWAAALTAARAGAETVLLERQSMLGGMGTTALVHTFCGLYHPDVTQGPKWLNPGLPTELGEELLARTGQSGPDLMGGVYVLRQHPSVFAQVADEWCRAEQRLTVACDAEVTSVAEGEAEWTVETLCRGRREVLKPAMLIDTTGDAAVARALGSAQQQTMDSARLYRPAYICIFNGLRDDLGDALRLQIAGRIVKEVREGRLPRALLGAAFRQSPFVGEAFLTIDLEAGGAAWDPLDSVCRAKIEAEGREAAMALWQYLRAEVEAFSATPPPTFPAQPGIRESVRWVGDYVVTAEDLVESRRFSDEVALAGWPMEMRETAKGPRFRFFHKPEPAGIPARSLFTSAHPRLWFAGRCLSSDHEALASLRVMGTCLATGQAAARLALK